MSPEKVEETVRRPLNVLVVEDSAVDARLLVEALKDGGFEVTYEVVDTPAAMQAALQHEKWDVITSDHAMPRFSGPAALTMTRELSPSIPFVIVSGEINLNLAVGLIKAGAVDYVQKAELARLVPVVDRILLDVAARGEKRTGDLALLVSEIRYRRLFEAAQD